MAAITITDSAVLDATVTDRKTDTNGRVYKTVILESAGQASGSTYDLSNITPCSGIIGPELETYSSVANTANPSTWSSTTITTTVTGAYKGKWLVYQ